MGYSGLGVSIIGSSVFNAINKPFNAMLLNVLRLFVCFVPFAWLGSYLYGLIGLFYGMMLGNVFAGLIAWFWLKKLLQTKLMNHIRTLNHKKVFKALENLY